MFNFLEEVLNQSFGAFITIFVLSLFYMSTQGGIFPGSLFDSSTIEQHFDSPVIFFSATDRDRVYQQTTFRRQDVKATYGSLRVDYYTDSTQPVGVKTNQYPLAFLINMSFYAKADKDCTMFIKMKDRDDLERKLTASVQLTTEWQVFNLETLDFVNEQERQSAKNSRSRVIDPKLDSYLEFSIQESPSLTKGTFWIDEIYIKKLH